MTIHFYFSRIMQPISQCVLPTKNKNTWLDRKEKDKERNKEERKLEAVEEPNLVSYYFTLSSSVTAADFTVVGTAADKGT